MNTRPTEYQAHVASLCEEHEELLAIVREFAGMEPWDEDGDCLSEHCTAYQHDDSDHDTSCLWLRSQKFKESE